MECDITTSVFSHIGVVSMLPAEDIAPCIMFQDLICEERIFWCENIWYNFLHTPAQIFGAMLWWYFNVGGFSVKISCCAYCLLCGISIEHKKCHLRKLSFICIFMAEHRYNESWKCSGCSECRRSHCFEHWCSPSFSIVHNEGWIRGELWFQVVFYVLFQMFVNVFLCICIVPVVY